MTTKNKVEKENVEDILKLTPMQEGLLFQHLSSPESDFYFEQLSLRLNGTIDHIAFKKAWEWVLTNNEMLRTIFAWEKLDAPIQVILKKMPLVWTAIDLSDEVDLILKEAQLTDLKTLDRQQKFDLTQGPLIRVMLCKLAESEYEMIISNHHLIYDGWSNGIILKEFFIAYRQLLAGKHTSLNKKTQFKEYIRWLNQRESGLEKEREVAFWQKYLQGFEGQTTLAERLKNSSTGRSKERANHFDSNTVDCNYSLTFSYSLTQRLEAFARRESITLGTLLYTAWGLLLQRYLDTSDIVFGTTLAGRPSIISGIEEMVGLFINTLPLRIQATKEQKVTDLLQQIQIASMKREAFVGTSLVELQSYSELKSQIPLFDTIMAIENYPLDQQLQSFGESSLENASPTQNLKITSYSTDERTEFPLTLGVHLLEEIRVDFLYDPELLSQAEIVQIGRHLQQILQEISSRSGLQIAEIEMLTPREREQILYDWNATETNFPQEKTLQQLFQEQVEKHPEAEALSWQEESISYQQLNQKANQLARKLQKAGVGRVQVVALMVERSLQMFLGIWGILKAGGAYLPIDSSYPMERIHFMLQDTGATLLLTDQPVLWQKKLKELNLNDVVEMWDLRASELYQGEDSNLPGVNDSSDLAYIIYTSGTTGQPKGTMTYHYNISRVVKNTNYIEITTADRILQLSNYVFDGSTFDIFGAHLNGATLVLIEKDWILDTERLARFISDQKISIFFVTTALFNTLIDPNVSAFHGVRKILFGGEQVSVEHVRQALEVLGPGRLIHVYGPTESTVFATYYHIDQVPDDAETIPIGEALSNTQVYILDQYLQPVPVGVPGEIYIGGAGLALGYLNQPELTKTKFIHYSLTGQRIYRTGDLARWLPDGNIEFIGRIDHQVKIRGFRIEPGEILHQIQQSGLVREAVVIAWENQFGEKDLCAYLVAESKQQIDVTAVREYLTRHLPVYMIPTYFVLLEKLPLTINGKVNRKELPEPSGSVIDRDRQYQPPGNPLEEKLVSIWEELLEVSPIGLHDHFFELGGHSLKATRLVGKIHKELNLQVPLNQLFKTPTIKGLSDYLNQASETAYVKIEPLSESKYYQTSSAQKRMYILQQSEPQSVAYNMPTVFTVEGNLKLQRVEEALKKLIQRHETLRTNFVMCNNQIVQKIHSKIEPCIEQIDLYNLSNWVTEEEMIQQAMASFVRPFDLSESPLLRTGVLPIANRKFLLLFDMHHIISDGTSLAILIREFMHFYDQQEMESLEIQYKDYAAWQNHLLGSDTIEIQKQYWLDQFADEVPILDFPTDQPRSLKHKSKGETITCVVSEELTQSLKQVAHKTDSTLFMVLLSAVNILLARYSGHEDMVIGCPIAGRSNPDLEKVIGMFINTLPMRNYPQGHKWYLEFLNEVKKRALQAFENQDYPFEMLVEQLGFRTDLSRNPLFDIIFVLQNMDRNQLELPDLKLVPGRYKNQTAKFDLSFVATEMVDGLHFDIEFSKNLFKRVTIERLFSHLVNILQSIVANPLCRLSELEMLSEVEKEQIVREFNDTFCDYPRSKTIHQLFAEQVASHPNEIAVVFAGERLTYQELDARANGLAKVLRTKGVIADRLVGIIAERSLEMIVGILATLKAGGAYLPIDPNNPIDRIKYLIHDGSVSILLSRGSTFEEENFSCQVIDMLDEALYLLSEPLTYDSLPTDLAYVIYTSGSTGKPKGVMVEHRNVVRLVQNQNYLHFQTGDKILQTGTLAFDASTFEIWGALLNGLELHLGVKELILRPLELEAYIIQNQITILLLTPPLFNLMAEAKPIMFATVKYLLVGGDILSPKHINMVRQECPDLQLINSYGPTENTTLSTYFAINQEYLTNIPIGKPINNSTSYIFDQYQHLAPIGVPGELWVGGDGLARGYLNNPTLTSEKFVESPLQPGIKLYRTGDRARWLPDGNIEFLGRMDHQVKIRGFRIEPGEIENQLLQFIEIEEVVVLPWTDEKEEAYLVAYLVAEQELIVNQIREKLITVLPNYMIPAYFIQLDQIPLTNNGKIDRQSLPKPTELQKLNVGYVAPRNQIERELANLWAEVLNKERVGIYDDFFSLGGHSLKATILASQIQNRLQLEFPLREIFQRPTIADQAEFLKLQKVKVQSLLPPIIPAPTQEYYPLSSAQKRIFILQQMNPKRMDYNMPMILRLQGELDQTQLQRAWQQLVKRHDALRTTFGIANGEPVQYIHSKMNLTIPLIQCDDEEFAQQLDQFIRPFDLSEGPLIHSQLIQVAIEEYYWLLDLHHIIADGFSLEILVRDFVSLYADQELSELKIQYKDYAVWQHQFSATRLREQEEYWLEQLRGFVRTDFPGTQLLNGAKRVGEIQKMNLPVELCHQIEIFCQQYGLTKSSFILAIFKVLLYQELKQSDLTVGVPIAGRNHPGVEGLMGLFLNVLIIRTQVEPEITFTDFACQVHQRMVQGQDHQDYPLDALFAKLSVEENLQADEFFSILYNYIPFDPQAGLQLSGCSIEIMDLPKVEAKYDLVLYVQERNDDLQFRLLYRKELYDPYIMQRVLQDLLDLIEQVVQRENLLVKDMKLQLENELLEIDDDFEAFFDDTEELLF